MNASEAPGTSPNVVVLADEYDVSNISELQRLLDAAAGGTPPLIAHFSNARYLDSSALAVILRRKAATGRDFRLVVATDSNVRLIFQVAGLIDTLPVHPDVKTALCE